MWAEGGGDEAVEEGVGLVGLGEELGVVLGRDEEGVGGELDDFDEAFVGGDGGDDEAAFLQAVEVGGVELPTVTMAFVDLGGAAVKLGGFGVGVDDRFLEAEAHGGAHVADAFLLFLQADDGFGGVLVELGGVGVSMPQTLRANSMVAICMPRQMPK